MSDNPKNPDDAPKRDAADPPAQTGAAIEAEWDEVAAESDTTEAAPTETGAEGETAPDAAMDRDGESDAPAGPAAAAAALAAAAVGPSSEKPSARSAQSPIHAANAGSKSEPPPASTPPEPEPKRGVGALAYVWLLLLTLGVVYLFYTFMTETPALRAAVDGVASKSSVQANADAIKTLQGAGDAATAAAAKADQAASDAASIAAAIDAARTEIDALKAAMAAGGGSTGSAGDPEAAAKAEAAIRAAETAQSVAQAGTAAGAANTAAINALGETLASLDERLQALEARAEKAGSISLAEAMLALNDLRVGLASGKPFGQMLSRAQAALPDAAALREGPWVPFADKGVPSEADLVARMQAISIAIGQDGLKDTLESGESWLDRAVGGVVDRLKVRRVGAGVEGDDAAAVAARAEAALLDGDVAKAVAEVEALSGAEAERFADWLAAAKAVEAAAADLDAVERAAIEAADGT